MGGQVAQLFEHHLSKQKVASSNPGSAWSWGSAKGLIGSMRRGLPVHSAEYSRNRVRGLNGELRNIV